MRDLWLRAVIALCFDARIAEPDAVTGSEGERWLRCAMVENLLDTEGAWRRRSEELVLGDYAVEPRHAVPPQQHGAFAVLISSDLGIGRNGKIAQDSANRRMPDARCRRDRTSSRQRA